MNIDDAVMNPGNGVILQLADANRSSGPDGKLPAPRADVAIPGRDLTAMNPKIDVFITVANTEVAGDFYNSTTNLNANRRTVPPTLGEDGLPIRPGVPREVMAYAKPDEPRLPNLPPDEERQGPRNLDLKFVNTKVKGIISAATAAYKEVVTVIETDNKNGQEVDAIIQTAHAPVNNGVIVSFDKDSVWTVAGTSYLTSLTIDKGAVIKALNAKTLTMTVDCVKTKVAPGTYKGKIVMAVV